MTTRSITAAPAPVKAARLQTVPTSIETRKARRKVLDLLARSWAAYQPDAETVDVLPNGYYGFLASLPLDGDDATVAGIWGPDAPLPHNVPEREG